ncbi:MlaD family protein [Methylocystis sp. B8]|uniref:MlaD family protein n=1 Tax=Methylocystis sp. B8 TaxID=544938 RepID=UPI0010FEBFE0|nr:MlaD family protein [Methylocystis sp. B8]TLG75578.1 MCE family protein [Methylocystis sp. B8]
METRANYALIGAFTLAAAFAAFLFVYWFSGPSQIGRQETYQIIFPGSVSGLTRGASVLFNGVKVGEVTHLGISEQDPSRVDVLVKIDNRTPVKTDTRARLEFRGFTGVADVLLIGGTPGAPDLTAQKDQKYPQIQAHPSEFQNLLVNVQNLSTKAAELITKLDKLVDEGGPALTATLKNAETVSKSLSDNSASIVRFIRDASDVAQSMKPVAARLDKVLAAADQTIKAVDPKQIKAITGNIAGASERINRFAGTGLREYEQLAVDGRKAIGTFDRTLRSVEKNPSQFIFGPSQSVPEYQGQ